MGNCPRRPIGPLTSPSALDKEIKYFHCSYPGCSFKSKWLDRVGRHEKIHNKSELWDIPCQVCHRSFGSLASFFHHVSSRHADKLSCPFCRFVAQDLNQFKPHILTHSHSFASNFNSRSSKRTASEFRCSTCSKSFSLKGNLTRHLKNNCCKVKQIFGTVGSLNGQSRTSSRSAYGKVGPGFRCSTCCTKFSVKGNLTRHLKNNHCRSKLLKSAAQKTQNVAKVKAIKTKCSKENKTNIKIEFRCGHCSIIFRSKWNLARHQKKNYSKSSSVRKSALKIRTKTRKSQRALYTCQQCSFKTSYVYNMRRHHRVHRDERPFKCPNHGCDYMSRWVENLQRHQLKHCQGRQIESKTSIEGKENSGPVVELVNKPPVNAKSSVALACMFCNFIGESEVSALKHSCEHKTVVILLNRI